MTEEEALREQIAYDLTKAQTITERVHDSPWKCYQYGPGVAWACQKDHIHTVPMAGVPLQDYLCVPTVSVLNQVDSSVQPRILPELQQILLLGSFSLVQSHPSFVAGCLTISPTTPYFTLLCAQALTTRQSAGMLCDN